jgi:hypothetical protein
LQKVICFRDQNEARIEDPRLLPLQLGPEVLEGRIGWGARRAVESSGEHDSGHLRRRIGHHPDPAGDDIEMFEVLRMQPAHDGEGFPPLLGR